MPRPGAVAAPVPFGGTDMRVSFPHTRRFGTSQVWASSHALFPLLSATSWDWHTHPILKMREMRAEEIDELVPTTQWETGRTASRLSFIDETFHSVLLWLPVKAFRKVRGGDTQQLDPVTGRTGPSFGSCKRSLFNPHSNPGVTSTVPIFEEENWLEARDWSRFPWRAPLGSAPEAGSPAHGLSCSLSISQSPRLLWK